MVGGLTFEQEQAERKEYVKNIEIEYKYGCYEVGALKFVLISQCAAIEEKLPESCQLLGEFMETVKKDFATAFKLFDDNCTMHQHPRSCYKVGAYLVSGKGEGWNAGMESDYYSIGASESKPDDEKAVRALTTSCFDSQKPTVQACRLLGLIHWNGEKGVREPDSGLAENCMKRQ